MAWSETGRPVLAVVRLAGGGDTPADPAVVREQVRRVMSSGDYSYEPSIVERITRWITDRLDDLFRGAGGTAPGTFGGGIGSVLAWLLILAAVAAIIAVVVVAWRRRIPRRRRDDDESSVEVEHRRPADDWAADAARQEAAGEWKAALRSRYRELVRTLVDRGQLPDVAGRTTGELRVDLADTTPDATGPFDEASTVFEMAWYAELPTGEDENRRFRAAAAQVLDAAPLPGRREGAVVEVTG
ncbi:MAG: DUF4129 domain-containing protein [Microthrixaceae bacterium]